MERFKIFLMVTGIALIGAMMGHIAVTKAQAGALSPVIYGDTVSASQATSITTNATNSQLSRAVYIGTTQALDFFFPVTNAWVEMNGVVEGTIYPIQVTGARIDGTNAAPNAGDVVFLD
jgi:hypothetical protein